MDGLAQISLGDKLTPPKNKTADAFFKASLRVIWSKIDEDDGYIRQDLKYNVTKFDGFLLSI